MTADELKTLQASVKSRYKDAPAAAARVLSARGTLDVASLTCRVDRTKKQGESITAGLHEAAGGDGASACSGDMLLEALVACAGVTLSAVATAMGIAARAGTIAAEGDLDFRGTLGVDKSVPVGFTAIRLRVVLDSNATADQFATLARLTERYCVVAQSLRPTPSIVIEPTRNA